MKDSERDEVERRLLEERERVLGTVRRLDDEARDGQDDGGLSHYRLHQADAGTDTIEQEQDFSILSAEARTLEDIDDALRRLYNEPDAFGRCEQCGRAIEPERLEIVPWTRLCAGDQKDTED
jgi:RNA polymerase-binding transcription factor DksA